MKYGKRRIKADMFDPVTREAFSLEARIEGPLAENMEELIIMIDKIEKSVEQVYNKPRLKLVSCTLI